jgi:1-hydroxy-2-isopentenylcarotenoid 3,4-desaturase
MKAVIIGAGFGGLSAAALLAKRGFEVEVIEQLDQPGGRATQRIEKGYVFDIGPSWYLAPDIFERFFALFGSKPEDHYELIRLDPSYSVFFENERITVPTGIDAVRALFESIEPGAGAALDRYLEDARHKYEVSLDRFLYKEYRSVLDFFTPELIREGARLSLFRSMKAHARRFFSDERLRKLVSYLVVFLGSSEKRTPAIYSLLSWADFGLGVWYPKGGFHAIARAFEKLAIEQGAVFSYDERVERIESDGVRARRVVTDKRSIHADVIIVNADYATAERTLLSKRDRSISERAWSKKRIAPSGLVVCLGIKGRIENLDHHMLFFDGKWDEHFDEVFESHEWSENPSFYVCAPSKTDDSIAPKGCENLFLLVPLAPGLEDTPERRKRLRDSIIARFEARIGERISDRIETEYVYAHTEFIERYGAYRGTAFGLAHTLFQSAVFRPSHRSKKLSNLYFTGHYTHPGVGVPMVIIASEIVADLVSNHAS